MGEVRVSKSWPLNLGRYSVYLKRHFCPQKCLNVGIAPDIFLSSHFSVPIQLYLLCDSVTVP